MYMNLVPILKKYSGMRVFKSWTGHKKTTIHAKKKVHACIIFSSHFHMAPKNTYYSFSCFYHMYPLIAGKGGGYSCRILAFCDIYKNLSIQASYIQEADKDIPWSLYLNNFSPKFFYQNSIKHTWIYMYMYISTNSITST